MAARFHLLFLFFAYLLLPSAVMAQKPWTIFIANDNCPDYTYGWSEAQTRQAAVLRSETCEFPHDVYQKVTNNLQTLAHLDQFGIVIHEAACGAKVDYGLCVGTLLAVSVYLGHYVMAHLFFSCSGDGEIEFVFVFLELIDLFPGDVQSELPLPLGESDPKLSECPELEIR